MNPPPTSTDGTIRIRTAVVVIGVVLIVAVAAVVLVWQVASTSATDGTGRLTVTETRPVEVVGEHVAFRAEVGEDVAIIAVFEGESDDGCEHVRYRLSGHRLFFEAISLNCDIPQDQTISNGFHGIYRTLDDVPEPRDHVQVRTDLGAADIVTQAYVEYTNSRNDYEDLVAVVTLAEPVDPDYPTLVVRSEKDGMDRASFIELVEQLEEPRGLTG